MSLRESKLLIKQKISLFTWDADVIMQDESWETKQQFRN